MNHTTRKISQPVSTRAPFSHWLHLVFIILCAQMSACNSRPSTPEALVANFLKAAQAGDYMSLVECMPQEIRDQWREGKKNDPTTCEREAKRVSTEYMKRYKGAKVIGAIRASATDGDTPTSRVFAVHVANVDLATMIGTALLADEKVLVKHENGRWVIFGSQALPHSSKQTYGNL